MPITVSGVKVRDRFTVEAQGGVEGWFLNGSNTGLAKHGIDWEELPLYTGSSTPAAGATITERLIRSGLDLRNGGITLERCAIRPTTPPQGLPVVQTGWSDPGPSPNLCQIIDCDFTGDDAATDYARAWTLGFYGVANLSGNHMWNFGSGFVLGPDAGDTLSVVWEGNYVHQLVSWGNPAAEGNHCDAFGVRNFNANNAGGRSAVIRNNRFVCDTANASGPCFIQTQAGAIYDVTLEGNLFQGNGYSIVLEQYGGTPYGRLHLTGNRVDPWTFGPGYHTGPGFTSQSGNYRYDAGNPPTYAGAAVTI